jgi:hypothetical protein
MSVRKKIFVALARIFQQANRVLYVQNPSPALILIRAQLISQNLMALVRKELPTLKIKKSADLEV